MERPCAWKKYTPQQVEELEELCRGYKQFLSENKTERLCVKTGIKMAVEAGYVDLETVIAEGRELKAGDTVTLRQGPVTRTLVVRGISGQRGPAPVAQLLYEETEESLRLKALAAEQHRIAGDPASTLEHGRPTKRDRRSLEKAQGKAWDKRWSASSDS